MKEEIAFDWIEMKCKELMKSSVRSQDLLMSADWKGEGGDSLFPPSRSAVFLISRLRAGSSRL